MPTVPLVTVLVAVADGERYVEQALESVLRQSVRDLELVVVDDGSTDRTPAILSAIEDPRLRVLRHEERRGLAASLNLGLDEARGRYVARLDADDVAMPRRLERQLARIRSEPGTTILGAAVCDLQEGGSLGAVHRMPTTAIGVRWHLLFGAPFFHPTVVLDREALEAGRLRYDPTYRESEDYDLWARTLAAGGEGANVPDPLVLYRVHPAQASQSRRALQRSFQLDVARREIARVAPDFSPGDTELAWSIGAGEPLAPERVEEASAAYVELGRRFASKHSVRRMGETVVRPLVHAAWRTSGATRVRVLRRALAVDAALPFHAVAARRTRLSTERRARREARAWLQTLDADRKPRGA